MPGTYVKKPRTVRLPAIADLQINSFVDGAPSIYGSYIYNGVVRKYPNGNVYITQRPGISMYHIPADESVTDIRGRGIYYWETASQLYIINDDTVYYDDYSTPCTNTLSSEGYRRVNIAELNGYLIFLDAQGQEMWAIASGSDTVLRSMNAVSLSSTDISFTATSTITTAGAVDFSVMQPGDLITVGSTSGTNDGNYTIATVSATVITVVETSISTETAVAAGTVTIDQTNYDALPQNNSLTLVPGLVVIDQTMYVGASNGTIWNCALGDPIDWDDGLFFTSADKEPDSLVAIEKHYDHLVAFGARTIEFLYDAANPTGSPLSIRDDISYNIGCADPDSIYRVGDDIYFLGVDTTGQVIPYVLREFKLQVINNGNLDTFLTTSLLQEQSIKVMGSALSSGGEVYYLLTTYTLQNTYDIHAKNTFAYNSNSQVWTEWEFADSSVSALPVVQYTPAITGRHGIGIMANGQLIYFIDRFIPYDSLGPTGDGYIDDTYIAAGYYSASSESSTSPIVLKSRIDNWDNDNRDWKYLHSLRFVGDNTENSNNLNIKWENDNNTPNSYTHSTNIDISNSRNKATRLGRFKSRTFEFLYQGTEQIRFVGVDLDLTEGTH